MSIGQLDGPRLKNIVWILQDWLGPSYVDRICSETGATTQSVMEWENGSGKVTGSQLRKLSNLFQKFSHTASGNSSNLWVAKGQQLLQASAILKRSVDEFWDCVKQFRRGERPTFPPDVADQMHMLRSFALECLFKALVLRRGEELFGDGKQVSYGEGHPLIELARDACVSLTKPERDMLHRLEAYVYLGRYPLLKKFTNDTLSARLDRKAKCHWSFPKDEDVFANVLRKVEAAFCNSNN